MNERAETAQVSDIPDPDDLPAGIWTNGYWSDHGGPVSEWKSERINVLMPNTHIVATENTGYGAAKWAGHVMLNIIDNPTGFSVLLYLTPTAINDLIADLIAARDAYGPAWAAEVPDVH